MVAPGQVAVIPATLRVGAKTGRKEVAFVIPTDSPAVPTWKLELVADLVAKQEVRPVAEEQRLFQSDGHPAEWRWRVITRRPADQRRVVATRVTVVDPLRARLIGTPRDSPSIAGVIETSQEIEILVPAVREFGRHNSSLSVQYDDGSTEQVSLSWNRDDPIRISPAGLVLNRAEGAVTRSFVIESTGAPIRIVGVASDLFDRPVPFPDQPGRSHRLDLNLDPSRAEGRATTPIVIRVDDQGQREVTVEILVLN